MSNTYTVFSWDSLSDGGTVAEIHNFEEYQDAREYLEACSGQRFIATTPEERQIGFALLSGGIR